MECKCDDEWDDYCEVHVRCDTDCKALREPTTLDEYKAAHDHWRSHGNMCGCSHGN